MKLSSRSQDLAIQKLFPLALFFLVQVCCYTQLQDYYRHDGTLVPDLPYDPDAKVT